MLCALPSVLLSLLVHARSVLHGSQPSIWAQALSGLHVAWMLVESFLHGAGTVCILAAAGHEARQEVQQIADDLAGLHQCPPPIIFEGSSEGATAFAAMQIQLQRSHDQP